MTEGKGPDDEADGVRRAQAGDEGALQVLFAHHETRLRAFIRARLPAVARGKVAQSDVMQQAYVTAFERLRTLDSPDRDGFQRWLLKIVDFKVREEVRRWLKTKKRQVGREVRIQPGEAGPAVPSRESSPATAAGASEDCDRLRTALELLDPAERTLLDLVHRHGLTYPEIGHLLGLSADAARMRHGRALAQLGRGVRRASPP